MDTRRRGHDRRKRDNVGDSKARNRKEEGNEESKEEEQEQLRKMKSYHLALDILQEYKADEKTKDSESCNGNINFPYLRNTEGSLRIMDLTTLDGLTNKEPSEVLLTLSFPGNGFKKLLRSRNYTGNIMMEKIITVLTKATKAREARYLTSLFDTVVSETPFIKLHLQKYLVSLQQSDIFEVNESGVLLNIIMILSKLQENQPDTSIAGLPYIVSVLNNTIHKLSRGGLKLPVDAKEKFSLLQKIEERANKKYPSEPPEDYRTISILPTNEDFANMHPFLRPNVVEGSYPDAGHYLDIQFRLLREDYIRPLRETIQKCRSTLGTSKKSLKNIRIYKNVHILYRCNTEDGLVHLISFDVKPFVHIHWEVSKRLLPGSLLCLSSDNFETMKVATVARRETSELEKGKLEIHFELLDEEIFSISPSTTFVMVESEAYFEAFRHTLRALQQIRGNEFPFKQYIVEVQKEIKVPKYLRQGTMYDFVSTFPGISQRYSSVPVLNTDCWPSKEELRLNHSQYSVLQASLTKEFVVIQGPPGTGKTYVGLKVTQMLLENARVWSTDYSPTPLLLVCYTNHALDQFLEGILTFTKDVVRVGGGCINDKVKEFKLSELRQKARENRKVPKHIYKQRRAIFQQIKCSESHLKNYNHDIESCTQEILSVEMLQSVMAVRHKKCLQLGPFNNGFQSNYTICDWLNIPPLSQLDDVDLSDDDEQISTSEDATTIFYDDDDDDDDFEVSFREIDEYEYRYVNGTWYGTQYKMCGECTSINSQFAANCSDANHKMEQYIKKQLKSHRTMKNMEEKQIENVWKLDIDERWSLYRLWIARYLANLSDYISYFQKHYQELLEKLRELRTAEDIYLLRKAKVIGMTTTGASKYGEFLQDLQPRIVIVEEAAEVLEAHVITSLAEKTQHLILIGDHQQLRPSPTVYELGKQHDFDISLFERMVQNKITYYQLSLQHRMRPSIAKLLTPHIYSNLENDPSVEVYENILGVKANMFFVNHYEHERNVPDSKSLCNLHEAAFLVKLCRYLKHQGYDSSQLTILTAYSGQLAVLKNLMQSEEMEDIQVTVIDNYQGEENDIVLISFVRSNKEGDIGFLKVSNRVCTALSRAKKGLYCIGNFELLARRSQLWRNITRVLKRQSAIGPSLPLSCQNHPEIVIGASKAEDFVKFFLGDFCTKSCNTLLRCGHICPRKCHLDDKPHTEVLCWKRCAKVLCKLGHVCSKICYEKCGPCEFPVKRICLKCNGSSKISCHLHTYEPMQCKRSCMKVLSCGHVCSNLCYQQCNPCNKVVKVFECKHSIMTLCCKANNYDICKQPCNRILSCGHVCSKLCYQQCNPCNQIVKVFECKHSIKIPCCEASNYDICKQPCNRILSCGHVCSKLCYQQCKPCNNKIVKVFECKHSIKIPCCKASNYDICKQPCNRILSCGHVCSKLCYQQCNPCNKIVKVFECKHSIKIPCCKASNYDICKQPCNRILSCGHVCSKLCYQQCNPCNKIVKVFECKHSIKIPCCKASNYDICKQPCNRILKCGHMCQTVCGTMPCPPCKIERCISTAQKNGCPCNII